MARLPWIWKPQAPVLSKAMVEKSPESIRRETAEMGKSPLAAQRVQEDADPSY